MATIFLALLALTAGQPGNATARLNAATNVRQHAVQSKMTRRFDSRTASVIFRICRRIAVITALACSSLLWTAPSLAVFYPLPSNKALLKPCREAALKLHPGVAERLDTRVRHGVYYYIFLIRASDGVEWLIACNAGTGEIVKSVGLDGL